MSRGNFRPRNPVCSAFDTIGIEDVAWCKPRQRHVGPSIAVTDTEVQKRKWAYLQFARAMSYAMPARSLYWSAWNATKKLFDADAQIDQEESILGGRFLRMYLDQSLDQELIEEAGSAIQASSHFAGLRDELNRELQRTADRMRAPLDSTAVRDVADRHTKLLVAKGLEWKKEGLNPVIGGVGGIDVLSAVPIESKPSSNGRAKVVYQLTVMVKDTYDFDNKRGGEYDQLRRELARLLAANRFVEFESELANHGLDPSSTFIKNYTYTSLFAAFMYALERRGWTGPGITWQVKLPMTVEFEDQMPSGRAPKTSG